MQPNTPISIESMVFSLILPSLRNYTAELIINETIPSLLGNDLSKKNGGWKTTYDGTTQKCKINQHNVVLLGGVKETKALYLNFNFRIDAILSKLSKLSGLNFLANK